MVQEHYRNVMHWRQLGVAACGQRTSTNEPVTRHCITDTRRVTCAKCLRLALRYGYASPSQAKQLDLDLPAAS